jgi:hypothetical protein
MKILWAGAAVLIASSAFAQNQQLKQDAGPPPTVDQCRADMSAWIDQSAPEDLAKLSYKEVMRRASEMSACEKIDPKNVNTFDAVSSTYDIEMAGRLADFIQRHRLIGQFQAEDTAGQR